MQSDNKNKINYNNTNGFAMVATLMFLTLLGLLAFSILNDTKVELAISGNEHFYRKNFNAAEGGTEVGYELLEESCSGC